MICETPGNRSGVGCDPDPDPLAVVHRSLLLYSLQRILPRRARRPAPPVPWEERSEPQLWSVPNLRRWDSASLPAVGRAAMRPYAFPGRVAGFACGSSRPSARHRRLKPEARAKAPLARGPALMLSSPARSGVLFEPPALTDTSTATRRSPCRTPTLHPPPVSRS